MIPEATMAHVAELRVLRAWVESLAEGRDTHSGADVSKGMQAAARCVQLDAQAAYERARPVCQPVTFPRVR